MLARKQNRDPFSSRLGSGRTSSKKVRYLDVLSDNSEINVEALVQRGKMSAAFGNVDWDAPSWNVSDSEQQRGHKQRQLLLHFTQHRRDEQVGTKLGHPFENQSAFADLVKAIIRLRREIGGQVVQNQNEVIIAFRYLYDELRELDHDLRMLTPSHLDAAVRRVQDRETEISAYKRIEKLEEIARLLDGNGVVRAHLGWSSLMKRRPISMRGVQLDLPEDQQANRKKLPKDGIIEAIATLYRTIPEDKWADRVRICLVSLLVITGFRIGELLTLPARSVETESDTGRQFLIYYPEKGAPPQKKWLMTSGGELAAGIIDELLKLTARPRALAKWLVEKPGEAPFICEGSTEEFLLCEDVQKSIGLKTGRMTFYESRGIEIFLFNGKRYVSRAGLISALRAETYDKPINVVKNSGAKLLLQDSLACAFKNAFHPGRATLEYAVLPISEANISDFISGRSGAASVFQRYGILSADGNELRVASHAFRHWLNDLLDRGGLSDVEQAVYFGRRNPKDNRAYQHLTPTERSRKARQDLKDGHIFGPVANLIARLPRDREDIVLEARVQAVHVVPGGVCFHQFSQSPCPNHMACTDGCGDFHWQTNDEMGRAELEYQKRVLEVAVETARREVAESSWGADSWLDHNVRKHDQVKRCLDDCCGKSGRACNG
ncbi:MAG: hypothetical protein ACK4F6_07010 [Hylemonella sp.]